MGLIHNTLNPSQWLHVHDTSMAKGIWNNLYQLYFVSQQETSIYFHIWDKKMSMTTHLEHMLELCQYIIECREEMNDRTFINILFMSLPQSLEWRALQNTLYRKGTLLTLNNVITELNTEFD